MPSGSIIDGNWSAAKYLEIFALEEASATTTAMLLQTRRHAKLAAKALGFESASSSWWRGGRGRGGKGPMRGIQIQRERKVEKERETTPKGGKKGNWNNDRNWQTGDGRGGKAVQDWADSKEQGKDA